jgi:hypothetical protein
VNGPCLSIDSINLGYVVESVPSGVSKRKQGIWCLMERLKTAFGPGFRRCGWLVAYGSYKHIQPMSSASDNIASCAESAAPGEVDKEEAAQVVPQRLLDYVVSTRVFRWLPAGIFSWLHDGSGFTPMGERDRGIW